MPISGPHDGFDYTLVVGADDSNWNHNSIRQDFAIIEKYMARLASIDYLKVRDAKAVSGRYQLASDESNAVVHQHKSALIIRGERVSYLQVDIVVSLPITHVVKEQALDQHSRIVSNQLLESDHGKNPT